MLDTYTAWLRHRGLPVPGREDIEIRTVVFYFETESFETASLEDVACSFKFVLPCNTERGKWAEEMQIEAATEAANGQWKLNPVLSADGRPPRAVHTSSMPDCYLVAQALLGSEGDPANISCATQDTRSLTAQVYDRDWDKEIQLLKEQDAASRMLIKNQQAAMALVVQELQDQQQLTREHALQQQAQQEQWRHEREANEAQFRAAQELECQQKEQELRLQQQEQQRRQQQQAQQKRLDLEHTQQVAKDEQEAEWASARKKAEEREQAERAQQKC
jgi:hypothetical protein